MMHRSAASICLLIVVMGIAALPKAAVVRAADLDGKLSEELLFSDDSLLQVDITIPEADWNELRVQGRTFVSALSKGELGERPFTYFRGDVSINGIRIPSVGIRKKGFLGSLDEDRPSLKIKFNEFKKNGKLAGLDRLTLNNNKQDTALVSQYLGYRLFRQAGVAAPRCSLAKVTVNGQSLGVYSNVESIKKPFLKNEFGDSSGNLYEGTYPADFYVDRIQRLEIKTNGKGNKREELIQIAKLLEKPDDELLKSLGPLIDLDRFHTFWAVESLIGFWDGYCANQNNYFIYRNPADSRFSFIPWGLDSAFTVSPFKRFNPGPASVEAKGLLAYRLYQIPSVSEKHVATVKKLLDTVWREEELLAEVDRVTAMTKDHRHEAQGKPEAPAAAVKGFIRNRRKQIEDEVKDGPVEMTTPPGPPMYFKEIGTVQGTFATTWSDKPGENRLEIGKAELNLKYGKDKVVKFKRVGVVAEPQPPSGFGPTPPGPPPPTLTFTAERESDGKKMNLWIGIPESRFRSSEGRSIVVQGMLMETGNFFSMRMMTGSAVLNAAERKKDAEVSGNFEGSFFQMQGAPGQPQANASEASENESPSKTEESSIADRILKRLDKDEDGKLSGDEIPGRLKSQLKTADKDRDGALNRVELQALFPAAGGKSPNP